MDKATKQPPDDVIFRVFTGKDARKDKPEVIAILPGVLGTNEPYTCQSYMSVGGHSSSVPGALIPRTRPATPEEYEPLMREMFRLGYCLRVVKRCGAHYYKRRTEELKRIGSIKGRKTIP